MHDKVIVTISCFAPGWFAGIIDSSILLLCHCWVLYSLFFLPVHPTPRFRRPPPCISHSDNQETVHRFSWCSKDEWAQKEYTQRKGSFAITQACVFDTHPAHWFDKKNHFNTWRSLGPFHYRAVSMMRDILCPSSPDLVGVSFYWSPPYDASPPLLYPWTNTMASVQGIMIICCNEEITTTTINFQVHRMCDLITRQGNREGIGVLLQVFVVIFTPS